MRFVTTMLGGLMVLVSRDVRKYRELLLYVGWASGVFGVALFFINRAEGLPPQWACRKSRQSPQWAWGSFGCRAPSGPRPTRAAAPRPV